MTFIISNVYLASRPSVSSVSLIGVSTIGQRSDGRILRFSRLLANPFLDFSREKPYSSIGGLAFTPQFGADGRAEEDDPHI